MKTTTGISRTGSLIILLFVASIMGGCGGGTSVDSSSVPVSAPEETTAVPEGITITSGRVSEVAVDSVTRMPYAAGQFLVKTERWKLSGLEVLGENSVTGVYQVKASESEIIAIDPEWYSRNHIRKLSRSWDTSPFDHIGADIARVRTPIGKIAVIDTGINKLSPDLYDVEVVDMTGGMPTVDDHGTHVTSIITANDNSYGITGVCPRCNTTVIVACSSYGCPTSAVQAAVTYAAYNGFRVVNMSLGGFGSSPAEEAAVEFAISKGVKIVAAAGNDSANAAGYFPCGYPGVICVGATYLDDTPTWASNYGPSVDIWAPGFEIESSCLRAELCSMSGTSMASPFVAAAMMAVSTSVTEISRLASGIRVLDLNPETEDDVNDIFSISIPMQIRAGSEMLIEVASLQGTQLTFRVDDILIHVTRNEVNTYVWDTSSAPDETMTTGTHVMTVSSSKGSLMAVYEAYPADEPAPEPKERGIKVYGTVTVNSERCEDCSITVVYNQTSTYLLTTDQNGEFTLKIPEGSLTGTVQVSALNRAGDEVQIWHLAREYEE